MYKTLAVVLLAVGLATGRQINSAGLHLIKEFEGFRANFYQDAVGIKTIGYGHACHVADCSKIHPPLSEAQGEALLKEDLGSYESCVEKYAPHVNENQFAALTSFVFNLGCGTLEKSTLLKDVQAKHYEAAANQFGVYVHAGGKVLAGLVRRRNAEKALFLKK